MTEAIRGWIEQKLTWLAMRLLARSLRRDPSYAWTWQCNLAMAFYDVAGMVPQGLARGPSNLHRVSNVAAANFLHNIFGVDIHKDPRWRNFELLWIEAASANSNEDNQP